MVNFRSKRITLGLLALAFKLVYRVDDPRIFRTHNWGFDPSVRWHHSNIQFVNHSPRHQIQDSSGVKWLQFRLRVHTHSNLKSLNMKFSRTWSLSPEVTVARFMLPDNILWRSILAKSMSSLSIYPNEISAGVWAWFSINSYFSTRLLNASMSTFPVYFREVFLPFSSYSLLKEDQNQILFAFQSEYWLIALSNIVLHHSLLWECFNLFIRFIHLGYPWLHCYSLRSSLKPCGRYSSNKCVRQVD